MRAALRAVLLAGTSTGLDLNFAGGAFSLNNTRSASPADIPGWSFSRTDTNGTATALDLAGNVIQFPSRTNLLTYSQQFDDAAWSKARASVTADTTVAPDGTTTADSLVEDTTNNSHPVYRTVASLANATAYTWSIFVAPLGRTSCNLAASNTAFGTPGNATFSLTGAGSVTASSGCTAAIQAVAGGFYRCSITLTTVASGNGDIYIQPFNAATSYLGNGLPALAIWGAQLETGSTATAYIPTTTAAVTVVLPRITNRGILVEEARTNLLLNSATLSTQTVTTTAVAHTLSFYGTGTVTLSGASTAGPLVGTGTSNRVTLTFTPLAAPLVLTVTGSVTTAQCEAGAFATSPIITTGAAGTRGADLPSQSFVLPAAYTWVAEGYAPPIQPGRFPTMMSSTGSNVGVYVNGSNTPGANMGNVTFAASYGSIVAAGSSIKQGFRAETNNAMGASNGTLSTVDTSFTPVVGSQTINIGTNNLATSPWNGYIRRVQVLPYAVTDAQLQALTAP